MLKGFFLFIFCGLASLGTAAQERFVDVDGAKLFCRAMGKGEPLLVLHGGPGFSQDYLLPHLEKLAEHNLVIFYDQRGCGNSTGAIDPKDIQFTTFVDDLNAVRQAFGFKKISILGHSFGGLLALYYTFRFPEIVDKLVLLDSMPVTSADCALFIKEWTRRLGPQLQKLQEIKESPSFSESDPETIERYYRLVLSIYCHDPKKLDLINMRLTKRAAENAHKINDIFRENFFSKSYDLQSELQKLTCKTLIIHGNSDPIPTTAAETTHKNMSNSQLVVFKECGHYPYVEKPDELFKLLKEFLREDLLE